MSAWIFPVCVNKKRPYWYEVDRAFETLRTLPWGQARLKSIAVGDTVYIYATSPAQMIYWRCRVDAVNIPPQGTENDEFEHGYSEPDDFYVRLTATKKFSAAAREKLSYVELRTHGLKSKIQSKHRLNAEVLAYINSIEASVNND